MDKLNSFCRWFLIPIFVGALLALFWTHVVAPAVDQIRAVQRQRTEFAVRCARAQGSIAMMGASTVCVAPDGRWVEWYS